IQPETSSVFSARSEGPLSPASANERTSLREELTEAGRTLLASHLERLDDERVPRRPSSDDPDRVLPSRTESVLGQRDRRMLIAGNGRAERVAPRRDPIDEEAIRLHVVGHAHEGLTVEI